MKKAAKKMADGGAAPSPPRSQRNRKALRKMAKGGVCRGMGAATKGGKFGKDG